MLAPHVGSRDGLVASEATKLNILLDGSVNDTFCLFWHSAVKKFSTPDYFILHYFIIIRCLLIMSGKSGKINFDTEIL